MTVIIFYISIFIILLAFSYQYKFYKKAKEGRIMLRCIFPEQEDDLVLYEDEDLNCTQINVSDEFKENKIFQGIRNDINAYLASNKGSVEYSVIKDITERHCDVVEQQIEAITPVPIYIGLCGTVTGIIIGVIFLISGGGLKDIISAGVDGIQSLLTGVAIAMITTLAGVLFTISSSNNTKESTEEYENEKNAFLSWVQVHLLPHMDGNITTTLDVLQRNLARFNADFYDNTQKLNKVFRGINDSYKEQADLVRTVQNLKINDIATANIRVLQELKGCTDQINQLQQFITLSEKYLSEMESLNSNLSNHYDRTKLIENMGQFFKDEVKQIEQRKAAISGYVADIDSSLKSAFEGLKEHTQNEYQALKDNTAYEHASFLEAIGEQKEALKNKLAETAQLIEELHNLTDVKQSMSTLVESTKEQGGNIISLKEIMTEMVSVNNSQRTLLKELIDKMDRIHVDVEMPKVASSMPTNASVKIPKWITFAGLFTCFVVVITCGYFVVKSIMQ